MFVPMDNVRDSDLILAQNEFAYVLDTNNGRVNVVVGPTKETLTTTEQPMRYVNNEFVRSSTKDAITKKIVADERSYVVLQNPFINSETKETQFPKSGAKNSPVDLSIGKSINIRGPISFPLWPGQVAKTIPGHHLRSNQYLVVRVINADEAKKNWKDSTIETTNSEEKKASKTESEFVFVTGKQNIIRGNEVSFYVPSTGVEVIADENGSYVRDALTLERLEYCVLKDENGEKEYVMGPAVVFPKPTQTFMVRSQSSNNKKFKALELNDNMGLHIKVISDYADPSGTSIIGAESSTEDSEGRLIYGFKAGEELFITGKDQKIYMPKPEHAIIKYGEQLIHYAIDIPKGEARYVLNKETGDIETIHGPTMYLPDPRKYTMVKRKLEAKTVQLYYPNNQEALDYNINISKEDKNEMGLYESNRSAKYARKNVSGDYSLSTVKFFDSDSSLDFEEVADSLSRNTKYTPPRTITLDTKYEGAININVWPGYAIQLVNKTGERKVVIGPKAVILDYDQTLEVLSLSTGNPKGSKSQIQTVYLHVKNNKVSDTIDAETKDLVNVRINLSYKVNFEDEYSAKWFNVQDYTKFLTDHLRSVIRNAVKKFGIEEFHANSIDIIRNSILGEKKENEERLGKFFSENGMKVIDVDVLGVKINNEEISKLLIDAQHHSVENTLKVTKEEADLKIAERIEEVKQAKLKIIAATKELEAELRKEEIERTQEIEALKLKNSSDNLELENVIADSKLAQEKKRNEQEVEYIKSKAEIATKAHQERMAAINDKLIAALNALSDKALIQELVRNLPAATGTNGYLFGTGGIEGLKKMVSGSTLIEGKLNDVLNKLNSRDGEGLDS